MTAEDLERIAQEQLAQAEELQRRLAAIVGEWTSPDRSVSLKVGPGGVLFDLTIRDQALSLGGERLATMILDGVQAAGKQAGDQARQAVADTVGDLVNLDDLLPPPPERPSRSAPSWLGDNDAPRTRLE